eukprot:369860-Hanusia_phi.AAC.1
MAPTWGKSVVDLALGPKGQAASREALLGTGGCELEAGVVGPDVFEKVSGRDSAVVRDRSVLRGGRGSSLMLPFSQQMPGLSPGNLTAWQCRQTISMCPT